MNYVIYSINGLSFFLVSWLNQVSEVDKIYFVWPNVEEKHYGMGLNELPDYSKLEVIQDINTALNQLSPKDTIVIIDDVGGGQTGKAVRDRGFKTIGGGVIADRLECDRDFATNLMKKVMNVPETFTFSSFQEGYAFLKSQPTESRLVFKPNDEDVPKEYTYVSKDVPDMIENMKEWKADWHWKEDFQLQTFIKGTEVDFNAYFNGKEYLPESMMIYFENKAIMNDDIGPAGGGAIAVQLARPLAGLFGEILEKLKPMFAKDGYRGCIAINSIISEEDHKPYFLEFTPRFGYPSLPLDITLLEDNGKNPHDLFKALVDEQTPKLFQQNKVAVVVSVGVPPYPSKDSEKNRGLPMKWDKKWNTYFFPSYIMKGNSKNIVLSGISNECLQVTCIDTTIDGAQAMLYDTYMPTLRLKGAMYRTDAGKDAKKRLKAVKDLGLF